MINQIYTIYDRVAEEIGPIVEAKNNSVAIRQWHNIMKNNDNKNQYDLLNIGQINTVTIELEVYEKPIQLDTGDNNE